MFNNVQVDALHSLSSTQSEDRGQRHTIFLTLLLFVRQWLVLISLSVKHMFILFSVLILVFKYGTVAC